MNTGTIVSTYNTHYSFMLKVKSYAPVMILFV